MASPKLEILFKNKSQLSEKKIVTEGYNQEDKIKSRLLDWWLADFITNYELKVLTTLLGTESLTADVKAMSLVLTSDNLITITRVA